MPAADQTPTDPPPPYHGDPCQCCRRDPCCGQLPDVLRVYDPRNDAYIGTFTRAADGHWYGSVTPVLGEWENELYPTVPGSWLYHGTGLGVTPVPVARPIPPLAGRFEAGQTPGTAMQCQPGVCSTKSTRSLSFRAGPPFTSPTSSGQAVNCACGPAGFSTDLGFSGPALSGNDVYLPGSQIGRYPFPPSTPIGNRYWLTSGGGTDFTWLPAVYDTATDTRCGPRTTIPAAVGYKPKGRVKVTYTLSGVPTGFVRTYLPPLLNDSGGVIPGYEGTYYYKPAGSADLVFTGYASRPGCTYGSMSITLKTPFGGVSYDAAMFLDRSQVPPDYPSPGREYEVGPWFVLRSIPRCAAVYAQTAMSVTVGGEDVAASRDLSGRLVNFAGAVVQVGQNWTTGQAPNPNPGNLNSPNYQQVPPDPVRVPGVLSIETPQYWDAASLAPRPLAFSGTVTWHWFGWQERYFGPLLYRDLTATLTITE